ncbi:MAG: UDP-N-acetylmuramate--L-alanine ligase [Paramuribaculum sp.]|nr:UDP-N-acetylmuramate--L-alanine ligase [Paramuribaculum sp.]
MTDGKIEKNNIYFVGAGGIGMAALERYFKSRGYNVAGYDRTASALTHALEGEGITISYTDSYDTIPETFRDPAATLVVYTPAIPQNNNILTWFKSNGFTPVKRAEVLGLVTRSSCSLCFAGTHGKTTTSSMAAHILHESKAGCNAFLGGVLRNYGTNFLLDNNSRLSVIEADEYDRSFHHLQPYVAVITSTDADHLDIYGTEEAYLESFAHFTELIQPDGALIIHEGLKLVPRPAEGVRVYTYSRDSGDFHASDIRREEGTITFNLVTPDGCIGDIELGVPVEINIENAIAAAAAVWAAGVFEPEAVKKALASFMGPKRRFEFHLRQPGHVIIDDYAHHPDELRASIRSVKALYPDRKLTVAFQPHLYSRTRDFAADFAAALSEAHSVVLLDIYPARELPIEGVTSQIIFDRLTCPERRLITKDEFVETINTMSWELLLSAGAGDIVDYLPLIVQHYQSDVK